MAALESLVQAWLETDKNETTHAEIRSLWESGNTVELERRLRNRIGFGTAGLRGRMEAGFARMNDLIIIQTSQGLCEYVLEQFSDARQRGVVIGHDHRYNSEKWARLTAAVFLQRGYKVYLHKGLVHTPLVPFTIGETKAVAGIMITASHNPKQDNGYKVYWENGVQIISPHDAGIAAEILSNLTPAVPSPWDEVAKQVTDHPSIVDCTEEMYARYFTILKGLVPSIPQDQSFTFVTTPMHGVGHKIVTRALQEVGFPTERIFVVEEQRDPDPEFPTVSFPNPEEHGALTLAMRKADTVGAAYVLAQDPDADRFTAAQKTSNGWHQFSGDQLGSLLGARALSKHVLTEKPSDRLAMVASTVSSKMLESMAKLEGFKFVECLTGFKYIGNVARQLEQQGYDVPFGYEEAIGFMLESGIRDKDGVSATAAFIELVTGLHARGSNALQYLQELYERYGYFETSNSYFICNDPPTIDTIFARLRAYNATPSDTAAGAVWRNPATGATYPRAIGSLKITSIRDLTSGYGFDSSRPPPYEPILPVSGAHMITFRAGSTETDGVSITLTIRTSGTEPKIKYYLEGQGRDRSRISDVLQSIVEELRTDWMRAAENNLAEP